MAGGPVRLSAAAPDPSSIVRRKRAASPPVQAPFQALEDGGLERLVVLPKDTPLAFLCHHGGRSAQAAMYFTRRRFTDVWNVVGGIDAWSLDVDPSIRRY